VRRRRAAGRYVYVYVCSEEWEGLGLGTCFVMISVPWELVVTCECGAGVVVYDCECGADLLLCDKAVRGHH